MSEGQKDIKKIMRSNKLRQKINYWGAIWIPTMIIGIAYSIFRRRRPPVQPPMKIAVFIIEHLGDAVISIPLLRELRATFPDAEITAVLSAISVPVLEKCPYLDRIIPVVNRPHWWGQLRHALAIVSKLAPLDLDLALVPKDAINNGFNELISIAASSKWKISLKPPLPIWRIKPMKFDFFYDEFVITSGIKHESEYRLDVVRRFTKRPLVPHIDAWLGDDDISFADSFVSRIDGGPHKKLIAFGIGASRAKRRWPLQNFAAVIDQLKAQLSFVPILIIGPDDAGRAEELTQLTSANIYFDRTASVRQSAALIARCSLFIGNDSGPMHVAASVHVPVVEISCHPVAAVARSFNSPARYGPFGVNRQILQPQPLLPICAENGCQFEDLPHCITQISSTAVVDAAVKLLLLSSAEYAL